MVNWSDEELFADLAPTPVQPRTPEPPVESAPRAPGKLSFLDRATDAVLAVPRGVEAAIQDTYGLADAIVGDALPDYDERVFGTSRTALGGFMEGAVNFATGFVPIGGALKFASTAGKLGRAAKLFATPVRRGLIAGALTDLTVFDGHEERLSNLIQNIPILANPVTDILAADEDESELRGRLEQVLEGLGAGYMIDTIFRGVKAVAAGRKARKAALDAGKGAEEAASAAVKALKAELPDEEARQLLNTAKDEDVARGLEPEPEDSWLNGPETDALQSAAEHADPAVAPPPPSKPTVPPELRPETATTAAASEADLLVGLGVDQAKVNDFLVGIAERREAGMKAKLNPRDLSTASLIANELEATDLNLSHWGGPLSGLQAVRVMEGLAEHAAKADIANLKKQGFLKQGLDERAEKTLAELADIAHASPEELGNQLLRSIKETGDPVDQLIRANARAEMFRGAMNAYSKQAGKLADVILRGEGSDKDMVRFAEVVGFLKELTPAIRGLRTETGRALRTLGTQPLDLPRNWTDELDTVGGRNVMLRTAKLFKEALDGSGAAGVTKLLKQKGFWGWTHEYRYFAMLSGAKTPVMTLLSNLASTVYRPFELMLGGALSARSDVVADAFREITGLAYFAPESFKAGKIVAMGGDHILEPGSRTLGELSTNAERRALYQVEPEDSVIATGAKHLSRLFSIPGNLLGGVDEMAKQMTYRTSARAMLMREASKRGLDPEAMSKFVADNMELLVDQGQALSTKNVLDRGLLAARQRGITDPRSASDFAQKWAGSKIEAGEISFSALSALGGSAMKYANEVAATTPLRPGSFSARLNSMALNHPTFRLIMPFIRTSVNLTTSAAQRLDLPGVAKVMALKMAPERFASLRNSQSRFVQDMLSGDVRRSAEAKGRIAAGIGALATTYVAASSGRLTGAGPRDLEQRRLLENAGWQPYSIRVGEKYLSYARFDPFAMVLGLAADMVDGARYAEEDDQSELETVTYGLLAAVANNFASKTYMQGLSETMQMLTSAGDDEKIVQRYVQRMAASFVPNILKQGLVDPTDPVMRDVRGLWDALQAKLPGLSDNLEPYRNLLGEPILRPQSLGATPDQAFAVANAVLPVSYRQVSNDPINRELAQLSYGFRPPKRIKDGLELTNIRSKRTGQSAFDRWGELHGSVKVGGKSIRSALTDLLKSPYYQSLSPVSNADAESPRVSLVRGVISRYRLAAWRQVLQEFPAIRQHQQEVTRKQRLQQLTGKPQSRSLLGRSLANPFEALTGQ